ncbi:MAG TPA: hypothetical protein DEP05_02820 [Betaproteobacteria bacterium]|nr:hypothetical protein [Betaproteobacteria bacterium]
MILPGSGHAGVLGGQTQAAVQISDGGAAMHPPGRKAKDARCAAIAARLAPAHKPSDRLWVV